MSTRTHRSPRAFTLVELLVVIGIIILLAGIVLAVLAPARRGADRVRLAAQLQAIAVALDAYKTDFDSYPVTSTQSTATLADDEANAEHFRGARLLCKALMGSCNGQSGTIGTANSPYDLDRASQDGKVGLGFVVPNRTGVITINSLDSDANGTPDGNANGKVYGPYLAPGKFKIMNVATVDGTMVGATTYAIGEQLPTDAATNDDRAVLLDANDQPILYYPCLNPQAPINVPFAHVALGRASRLPTSTLEANNTGQPTFAGTPMYRGGDNAIWLPTPIFRELLGDLGDGTPPAAGTEGDGRLTGAEVATARGKYILWSNGPDERFGPDTKNGTVPLREAIRRPANYDDVTNFQGE